MHQVHFLEVFHAGCYLRGHVDQRAETATGRTRGGFQKFCTTKLVCECARARGAYTQRRIGSPQMTTLVWKYVRMDRPFALTRELVALLSSEDPSWWKFDHGSSNGFFLMVCTMILRFSSGSKICNKGNCSSWKIGYWNLVFLYFSGDVYFLFNSINFFIIDIIESIIEYFNLIKNIEINPRFQSWKMIL